MRVLVTGAAGFIGYHVARRLLERGDEVTGVDDLNPYYDPSLKKARVRKLLAHSAYTDIHADIAQRAVLDRIFGEQRPARVVHLAAQAGVRYSTENPQAYIDTNLV